MEWRKVFLEARLTVEDEKGFPVKFVQLRWGREMKEADIQALVRALREVLPGAEVYE